MCRDSRDRESRCDSVGMSPDLRSRSRHIGTRDRRSYLAHSGSSICDILIATFFSADFTSTVAVSMKLPKVCSALGTALGRAIGTEWRMLAQDRGCWAAEEDRYVAFTG